MSFMPGGPGLARDWLGEDRPPAVSSNYLWLIKGFDSGTWTNFIPDPSLFRTEREAKQFCSMHSGHGLIYSYVRVQVGRMELSRKKPDHRAKAR